MGETGDVILVGVGEHEQVDPPVPWRQTLLERDEESVRVRATVDEQASAPAALDEDRITLPDVEDGDPGDAVRTVCDGEPDGGDRSREDDGGEPVARPSPTHASPTHLRGRAAPSRHPAGPDLPEPLRRRSDRRTDRAPRGDKEEDGAARDGGEAVERRCELDARERHGRPDPDDAHDRAEQQPGRQAEQRGDGGHAERAESTADERQDRRGHRRCDERRDRQVHRR